MKEKILFLIFLIFLLLLPTWNLLLPQAQEPKKTQSQEIPQPAYEVEVIVTNVDVIVTDRKGNRITGLKPENFELYEDGIRQKLTNFYEVKGFEIYAASPERKEEKLEVLPQPLPQKTPRFNNKIIFYFDNWHLHPLNRNWSIKKLESFIRNNFSAEDDSTQGMVVSLEQKLEIIQDFTSNPHLLLQALDRAKEHSGQSLLRQRNREDLRKELNRIVEDTNRENRFNRYEQALGLARNYVEAERGDLEYTLKSINAFLDYLIGIEGKKILIYVSDGLPLNPSEEVFSFLDQAFPFGNTRNEILVYDETRLFKELTARCNANEIALYPINAQGLESMILSADKESGWKTYSRGAGMVKPGSRLQNDALKLMAEDTGGIAVLNTNEIEKGLEKIKEDLQFYYSLGYVSPHREDNRYHSIEVRVVGVEEEYEVRLRKGYTRISPEEMIRESVYSRLYLPRLHNPMKVMVQVLPLELDPATKKIRFTLKVLIPIKNLTLYPQKDEYVGQIRLYIALMDEEGLLSPCHELVEQIKIPAQDYEVALKSSYPYLAEMYLDPGKYTVSLALRDVPGQVINYIQFEKTIEKIE